MNAQELTKKVIEQENRIINLENEIKYLQDTVDKLTLRLSDLEIDVKQR